jgi:hypothetical protein
MGVMEHFLLLVPGPLPGCIFMRHIILALFTVYLILYNLCGGLSHPTGWAALPSENKSRPFFSRAEKPSEDITGRLFLMNTKGF